MSSIISQSLKNEIFIEEIIEKITSVILECNDDIYVYDSQDGCIPGDKVTNFATSSDDITFENKNCEDLEYTIDFTRIYHK